MKAHPLWRLYVFTLIAGTVLALGAIGFLVKDRGKLSLVSGVCGSVALIILGIRRRFIFPKVKAAIARGEIKKS